MVCPEDLGGKPGHNLRQVSIDLLRSHAVEHCFLPFLDEFLEILDYYRGRLDCAYPPDRVLTQEIEGNFPLLFVYADVLWPQGRCTHRVGLVLVLLVPDPHLEDIDQVADCRNLPLEGILRLQPGHYVIPHLLDFSFKLPCLVELLDVPDLLDVCGVGEPDILHLIPQLVLPPRYPE